jgi:hypothetical protein
MSLWKRSECNARSKFPWVFAFLVVYEYCSNRLQNITSFWWDPGPINSWAWESAPPTELHKVPTTTTPQYPTDQHHRNILPTLPPSYTQQWFSMAAPHRQSAIVPVGSEQAFAHSTTSSFLTKLPIAIQNQIYNLCWNPLSDLNIPIFWSWYD